MPFAILIHFSHKKKILQTMSSLSNSTNLSEYRMPSSNKSSPSRSQCNNSLVYNIGSDEKSFTSMSSIYGKNSGIEIKTCAALQEMSTIRIPSQGENWWCILVSCVTDRTFSILKTDRKYMEVDSFRDLCGWSDGLKLC